MHIIVLRKYVYNIYIYLYAIWKSATEDMIVAKVFLLIMSQTEFHLVHNPEEKCHHDYIIFR